MANSKYGGEEGIEERRAKQLSANADRRAKKRSKVAEQASWSDAVPQILAGCCSTCRCLQSLPVGCYSQDS